MSDLHPLYYAWEHKTTIMAGLLLVTTAGIATAPVPVSRMGLWLYDWAHQVFNIKNTRLLKESIPMPPDPTPAPQETK